MISSCFVLYAPHPDDLALVSELSLTKLVVLMGTLTIKKYETFTSQSSHSNIEISSTNASQC